MKVTSHENRYVTNVLGEPKSIGF